MAQLTTLMQWADNIYGEHHEGTWQEVSECCCEMALHKLALLCGGYISYMGSIQLLCVHIVM